MIKYDEPKMELLILEAEDIVTSLSVTEVGGDDGSDFGAFF